MKLKALFFTIPFLAVGVLFLLRGPNGDGPPAWADPETCVAGDVDGDGTLNITDPVVLLRFLFEGSTAPVACRPAAAEPPTIVVVSRHAEKDSGTDPGLTPEGKARAERLAFTLGNLPATQLLASDLKRTQETIQPLAALKGMAVELLVDTPAVLARVRSLPAGSIAVLVHHSYTLPDILEGLGVQRDLLDWDGTSYDNLLVLILRAGEATLPLPLRY
jgi:hypothetical protein